MTFDELFEVEGKNLPRSTREVDIMSHNALNRTRTLVSYHRIGEYIFAVTLGTDGKWADIGRLAIRRDGDMAMEIFDQVHFLKDGDKIIGLEDPVLIRNCPPAIYKLLVVSLENHFGDRWAMA